MTIKVGDRVPDATLTEFIETETAGCTLGPNAFQVADLVKGKKILMFALPGAFTPTCSAKHVPGYVEDIVPHHGMSSWDAGADYYLSLVYQISLYIEIIIYDVTACCQENSRYHQKDKIHQAELQSHCNFLTVLHYNRDLADQGSHNKISHQNHCQNDYEQIIQSYKFNKFFHTLPS